MILKRSWYHCKVEELNLRIINYEISLKMNLLDLRRVEVFELDGF